MGLKSVTQVKFLHRGDGVAGPEGWVGAICWKDVGPRVREQFRSEMKKSGEKNIFHGFSFLGPCARDSPVL